MKRVMKRAAGKEFFGRMVDRPSDFEACKPLNHKRVWDKFTLDRLIPAFESHRGQVVGRVFTGPEMREWIIKYLDLKPDHVAFTRKPSKEDAYRDSIGRPRVDGPSVWRITQKIQRYLSREVKNGTLIRVGPGQYRTVVSKPSGKLA